MSFELLDTIPIGSDANGQFRFIVVMRHEEKIKLPIPVNMLPIAPVKKLPKPTTKTQYAPFPKCMEIFLQRYVALKEFPVQWNATPIDDHPIVNRADYDERNLHLVAITLPRQQYPSGCSETDLSELLTEPKAEALMTFLKQNGLAIVKKNPKCHCDNYFPGDGCGYKGARELICLNCASLCPICLEPMALRYDEDLNGGGCYDCPR